MASNYPTALDNLTFPSAGKRQNNPSHRQLHEDAATAINALQEFLGIDPNPADGSMNHRLSEIEEGNADVYALLSGRATGQSLALGTLTDPQSELHIDGGDAVASALKFTAGSTTGQTASDGFDVGIATDGNGEIRQREAHDLGFFTDNTERMKITSDGRFQLGPTSSPSPFYATFALGLNAGGFEIIEDHILNATPPAIHAGGLVIGTQYTLDSTNNNTFGNAIALNCGLGITSDSDIAGIGAGVNCLVEMAGAGNISLAWGGIFNMVNSGTGTMAEGIGGLFQCNAEGGTIIKGIAGQFLEPGEDGGTLMNRTAIDLVGTISTNRTDTATVATINALAIATSWHKLIGSTATALNGIAEGLDGKELTLTNASSATMTVNNESGSASAANRIITATGGVISVAAGESIEFRYDSGSSRWRHIRRV